MDPASPAASGLAPSIQLVALQFILHAGGWLVAGSLMRRERAVLWYWALFSFATGVGFLLMALRGEPRTWMAFNGSALAFVLGELMLWRGVERHFGLPPSTGAQAACAAVVLTFQLWAGPGIENAALRVIVSYGTGALIIAWMAVRAAPVALREHGFSRGVLVASPALILVTLFGGLVLRQLADPSQPRELHRLAPDSVSSLASILVATAIFTFSLLSLVVSRLIRRVEDLSRVDALTGLFNRRHADGAIEAQWSRWQRQRERFSVALLDLDHFKRVNDTRGHAGGDAVLMQTAATLKAHVRPSDTLARMGGEEFLLLMPHTALADAQRVADRLCRAIAQHDYGLPGEPLRMTVSIGVSAVREQDADAAAALRRADAALYRAKDGGRARVMLESPWTAGQQPA